ncbi:MAG: hypothetical protein QM520_04235 [Gammaproteobacteria bacterium]|nr:hypothetical protein [Gammaproteobacteria bacterium]
MAKKPTYTAYDLFGLNTTPLKPIPPNQTVNFGAPNPAVATYK